MILPQLARERVADFYPLGELDVNLRAPGRRRFVQTHRAPRNRSSRVKTPFAFDRLVTRPADCPALGNLRPRISHNALAMIAPG